ncbi:hypothetical protein VNI00_015835 [Paramarasmius palmivorus]|uniref:NACHT domain-containing protein n=1 Tax=Paramarasmius palmivorus TaxID=297713 RepID=A0AAW0BJA3_9AGAR
MFIHKEKYRNCLFKLSIKTEHTALSLDSSTPTVTLSTIVDLQQRDPHSDSQECVTKGDDTQLSVEPVTERLTIQAELRHQIDQSAAEVDTRLDDSSSSSTSPSTTAFPATQTERHPTADTSDDSRGLAVDGSDAPPGIQAELQQSPDEVDRALDETSTSKTPASQAGGRNSRIIDNGSKQPVAEGDVELETEMEKLKRRTENRQRIYQITDVIITALDHLSEIHESARIAFIVVSKIYDVIKAKHEQNEAIVALHGVMVATYDIAVKKDALNEQGDFSGLFDEIVQQSQECYVFLSNYMVKGLLSQVMDFWKTSSKIEDFNCAFEELQKRFFNTQVEVTTVAVLDIRRTLESLQTKQTLRILKPSRNILRPKSHCMLGTRRASIGKILDWAFHGEETVLWISGIAGCGKSSLIGTLHNTLSTFGFNSRLAAFIRFDRSEYNDAGEFIKALAFLLANFDERFGKPIAEVVERSRQIAETTDLSTQVQKLLINPLRGLSEEIAKEGRIVILVDGIDECSREDRTEANFRKQLLELFTHNAFRLLPFLRFVLASRPEEDIVRYLQGYDHIHHFPLDHTSDETKADINYFLTVSFRDPAFNNLDDARKSSATKKLAERASGLFIWAATVIGFIKDNVAQRLKLFTENEPPKNALHALTVLYKTALDSLVNEQGDDDIKQNICTALGLIMVGSSDKRCTVTRLCGVSNYVDPETNPDILGTFQKLRSLITEEFQLGIFTRRSSKRYQLLHKSFDDYLTSKDRAGHWYIDMKKYEAILYEAMITCTMDHLDKANKELPKALSSDLCQYVIWGPRQGVGQDLSLYQSLQQKLKRFLLGYVLRWLYSFDYLSETVWGVQQNFGEGCYKQAEKLQHDSEFIQKALLGASCLQDIEREVILVKDFFDIMLYNAALTGKVTKTNPKDQPDSLEWEVDNIYMSVFVQMAGGSNVYEEIVAELDKVRKVGY